MKAHNNTEVLPIIALLTSQLVMSSWHVLGKHVMHTVPYVTPMTYVLVRTGITACMLLICGRILEGAVEFPALFLADCEEGNGNGVVTSFHGKDGIEGMPPLSGVVSLHSVENDGICLTLSRSGSIESMGTFPSFVEDKKSEDLPSLLQHNGYLQNHTQHNGSRDQHRHRRRMKGKYSPGFRINALTTKLPLEILNRMRSKQMNIEAVQIFCAGLSGMFLLPLTYTTGLVLTTPTVASVWDGPMIPLGCFLAAVSLGVEKRSHMYPRLQIGSLILAVGGSLIVLLIDYTGGGGIPQNGGGNPSMNHNNGKSQHWEGRTTHEFLQGNMVLMGVVAAYSAMALLQKRLNHYPPMTLTGWMFGFGFVGCIGLVLLDSLLVIVGINISGCTLHQCIRQIYRALTTSPTFRYGLLYACFFVGGICFSIASYAASHLESSVITLFAACQPPMTALLEWIWEGKGLGWKKIFGMICVGVGMWCFTYIKRVEKVNKDMHLPKRRSEQTERKNGVGNNRKGTQALTYRAVRHADV
mmetsp:Transcript_11438/g.24103  ORF Transcript_11438/g.24103 Transcript_11438/m.24103 type:complete len:526 (+) Transcript_11438:78-1655(+)